MRTPHGSGRYVVKHGAGVLLKQARLRAGLKQYKLGELLGFRNQRSAQAFVHAMESGREQRAMIEHVMNAASILSVPLGDVIEWIGEGDGGSSQSGGDTSAQGSGHSRDAFSAA